MDTTLGRIPPNNTEAEESVIGAMLLDKEAVNTALEILKPEDFYKEVKFITPNVVYLPYSELPNINFMIQPKYAIEGGTDTYPNARCSLSAI